MLRLHAVRALGAAGASAAAAACSSIGAVIVAARALPYDRGVAYDQELAARIRALVAGEPGLTEQKMFGGLAFLIGGNMAVAASGQGGALVRVDPAESDALVASTSARPMEMRGREMAGWLRVDAADLGTEAELAGWVERGTSYARSLPPKSR
jgi:hypothetical protein